MEIGVSCSDVTTAGEIALCCLYYSDDNNLISLRHKRFHEKVSKSTKYVQPKVLPPTSSAAKYHSLRVYLQVQEWLRVSELNPLEWGWKLSEGQLVPVETGMPVAPKYLLETVSYKTDCNTVRCSCRKNGIKCSLGCGECKRMSCQKVEELLDFMEDNVDDEDKYVAI